MVVHMRGGLSLLRARVGVVKLPLILTEFALFVKRMLDGGDEGIWGRKPAFCAAELRRVRHSACSVTLSH